MNCETIQEYLDRYGPLVAERARQAFEPLHVPSTDAVVTLDLKRAMLPAQGHVVTSAVKTLNRQKSVFLCCECGTGKSQISACTVHAHAAGKPYRAIVMCPPHIVETWRTELQHVFHEGTADVHVLESWREMLTYPRGKPTKPSWLIMGETIAKNGPYWRAAAVKDHSGLLRCPDCGAQLRSKAKGEGNFLSMQDLERSRKTCTAEIDDGDDQNGNPITRPCGAALWQYYGKPIWAPADYIHRHMKGVFDYLICDEIHEEKSDTSARANALGSLVASCRKVIGMTGTLIGGKAIDVRSLLFRLSPKSLKAENLAWENDMEFARRYGRVDTIITEKTGLSCDNRRSNGKSTTKRQAEQPGIMPTLYGRHLIGNTIFLGLTDVAADLPDYDEHPTSVSMSLDLAESYRDMEGKLKDAVADLLRKGSHQLLSAMLHALLAYPDYPYDWKPVGYVDENRRFITVACPPTLNRNSLWPKEVKLLEILRQEKEQGRQCWVFCVYTSTHPVLARLEKIIRDAGFSVKVLEADKVPTRSRSAWIASNAPGVDVIISHPQPVRTGLTLFDAAGNHNFPSLIFYETGYDLFTLRQASRRSWRIGQKCPCRVYYLYYKETMQARAMALMAQKLDASLALEGQFSAEGLAAMSAESGSLTMELAKSLVETIDFGDAERVWEKFRTEPPQACEAIIVNDADFSITPSLVLPKRARRTSRNRSGNATLTMPRQFDFLF
ncbi:MAG: DEAD/DEAH box helicase [Planctomycetota bacterium]